MDIILLLQNKYILSLSILIGFFIVSKIIVYISEKYILHLTKKTQTEIDDLIVEKTNKPVSLLLLLIGLWLALLPLGLNERLMEISANLIKSLIIISIGHIIITILDLLIDFWGKTFAGKTRSNIDDALLPLFHKFSRAVIIIIAVLYILQTWGIEVGPLLASLGIAGLAIAFALQSTLGNIFGGVSIIMDKTVKAGDVIKLDADTRGTVLDIGLRSTKIKTFDNEVIIVPNGKLSNSKIQNYILPDPSARFVIEFGVDYGSDIDKVKKTVTKVIKKIEHVSKDPEPKVIFTQMGDSALKFKALVWVDDYSKKFGTKEKTNCEIYKALNKAKIGIPFPTQTLYVKKGK